MLGMRVGIVGAEGFFEHDMAFGVDVDVMSPVADKEIALARGLPAVGAVIEG